MKTVPQVEKFMTPLPHTINSGVPVKTAKEMMKKFGVRHLPVQVGGHLVGIVSDRDLKLAQGFDNPENLLVADVMTTDPYTVPTDAEVSEVAKTMAEHKYGCAIVQNPEGKVVGILTSTDGLRELGTLTKKPAAKRKGGKK